MHCSLMEQVEVLIGVKFVRALWSCAPVCDAADGADSPVCFRIIPTRVMNM